MYKVYFSSGYELLGGARNEEKNAKKKILTRVGFEPTHISVVEIQAALKSTALDHSAIVSMEKSTKF